MAYAAVTSLMHTIHHLLESSRTSVAASTIKTLKSARRSAKRLQRTLERFDEIKNSSAGVLAVDARIREEARKLEDAIESQALAQLLSQSQSGGRLSLNLNHLRHDVDCFVETAKKMRAEYIEELFKPPSVLEEAAAAVAVVDSSSTSDLVGFSDRFFGIRDFIAGDQIESLIRLVITGMAGIGKTTFVKKLFHDSLIEKKFECRAFVRVGQKYNFEEISRDIINQLNDDGDNTTIMEGDENISQHFKRSLRGRKFLIVLDDVWDEKFEKSFAELLPENCDGSFFLVTSRIRGILRDKRYHIFDYPLWFLNAEESWELLKKKVFHKEECPIQLVKTGKKIAENCEGLPLLIITIAKLLSKAPRKAEYWNEVAEMKNLVFEDAMDQIYDVLLPSYHFIVQNAKACFLYMGVFPKNHVVRRSRIINLWHAEKFSDGVGNSVLDYIVCNNLAIIREKRLSLHYEAKAYNLHVVNKHLSRREGENSKFVCILDRYTEDSIERIRDKRRLAIYHNTLLAIKEVHISIASVSSLRSVLCTGPYHPYQVPICSELKQLRVLDALTIRFYEFPLEVVKLIQLRYLSLTTNANLHPFIHQLCFLEFLIVHQHLSIKLGADELYVPVEIWELKELKHLQIVGRNLPHPPPGAILPDLTQLLDVGVQTCVKGVLENIPNLQKLRIRIELGPNSAQTTISCFDHIYLLGKLESLRSVVMNPNFLPALPPRLLSISTSGLGKLSLSGFGYAWEDMSKIAELPLLRVLKLQYYAFRGDKWEATETRFEQLVQLLIEDTDLVEWTAADETSFPSLRQLIMKNCHKLREIPHLKTLYQIELFDCNPLAETWAKEKVECGVQVNYSWK